MGESTPKQRAIRFGLRTVFVLVTLAAVALGLWRRAYLLHRLSEEHAAEAHWFAASRLAYEKWPLPSGGFDDKRQHLSEQHALHREWSKQYRLAIWRPWLNPEGDLPLPKPYRPRSRSGPLSTSLRHY